MSNKVEIKRELLIKTALKMIEKEGIANFSVRKLTEACGCDRQAPYRMYGSKEGLVQELYTRILIALGNYVLKRTRLRKQRGEEAYLVIIEESIRYYVNNPGYSSIFLTGENIHEIDKYAGNNEQLIAQMKEYWNIAADFYKRAGVPEEDMEKAFMLIRALIRGISGRILRGSLVLQCGLKKYVVYMMEEILGLKAKPDGIG